jgi:uroporphyrinogen-III synthase
VAALKRRGLAPTLVARDPFTSDEVLEVLDGRELNQTRVVLVHYGERSDKLAAALRARGARLDELCLYEWQLPEDTQPMVDLIGDVLRGNVDSVVFTSQIQGRHLLQIAAAMGVDAPLVDALNARVVVAAVGPVCRAALEEAGIMPHVVPTNPKMGPLIASLAEYFSRTRRLLSGRTVLP